ncbi:MAG: beta-lactamase family protein [Deltaproteobacteria bacterium]|nr:beta-lactamase family protein [Deltaproteobacteria bacterium]
MQRIVGLVEEALVSGVGSAAAVSVGDGGREIFRHVCGRARRLPEPGPEIDERAWFDLASLTKPMATVACAMVLAGEGRLDLDEPVRRWIPGAATVGTVRELLGHASGCIAHVELFRTLRRGAHPDRRAELIELAARVPAQPPGAATVYTDLGFLQLGAVVERAAELPLERAFAELVAGPLDLGARYVPTGEGAAPLAGAVATELVDPHADDAPPRGLVEGFVHDENAFYGGGVCGHAGLFATIGDVARFAAAIVQTWRGEPRGRLRPEVVRRFASDRAAPTTTWRLGWDTPSVEPGVSSAGDRWPRAHAIGHTGFTGTSIWLDLARGRWVVLLANRVHPTRGGTSADDIKALRRAVADTVVDALGLP